MQYTVWIVSPPNYTHSQAFNEVSIAIRDGLIELGHTCTIVTSSFECRGRTIVLGCNLLAASSHFLTDLPGDLIFYNLEQVDVNSPWFTREYVSFLRGVGVSSHHKREVWDYSAANIVELGKLGIEAKLCEVGYVQALTRIESVEPQWDVLHYGSMTERRMQIINRLAEAGVKVHGAFGVYGKERDALIAKSKIVLNVHFYESRVWEIVRCSYLLSNRKCIVSETGNGIEGFEDGVAFCEYGDIADRCVALLADDAERERIAQRGFEIFSQRRQAGYLRAVL